MKRADRRRRAREARAYDEVLALLEIAEAHDVDPDCGCWGGGQGAESPAGTGTSATPNGASGWRVWPSDD